MTTIFSRKTLGKLPGIRRLKKSILLRSFRGEEIGVFRGRFPTYEDAQGSLPPSARSGYDDEQLVAGNLESFSRIHAFDWPVIALCQRLIREAKLHTMTDFGGHVGVKYYAFEKMLDLKSGFAWQVVDVPAMIREGRARMAPGNTVLKFFETLEETGPAEGLLLSGVLQYARLSIEEIFAKLPKKPYIVFLNKVPVSDGCGYFTIEKYIKPLPYRIYGAGELDTIRERLGYQRVAQWPIAYRNIITLSSSGMDLVNMIGEAWCLDELS